MCRKAEKINQKEKSIQQKQDINLAVKGFHNACMFQFYSQEWYRPAYKTGKQFAQGSVEFTYHSKTLDVG